MAWHTFFCTYSILLLYDKGGLRQYVNEWACLCFNKTLFTKTGSRPDLACGPQFANTCSREKRPSPQGHSFFPLGLLLVAQCWWPLPVLLFPFWSLPSLFPLLISSSVFLICFICSSWNNCPQPTSVPSWTCLKLSCWEFVSFPRWPDAQDTHPSC